VSPTWREIWDRRQLDPSLASPLAQLMAADGMNTGFCGVTEDAWRGFVRQIAAELEIGPGTSIFEVGCGAGAFLYGLYENGCSVAGIDLSDALVSFATRAMPRGRFAVGEATSVDPADPYDIVVSCGVFLYFPSLEYARTVITRMAAKARRAVAILDVPDLARREQALVFRRGTLGEAEYQEKYRGLDHLYYDRNWVEELLRGCGVLRTRIEDQAIPGYGGGAYRFNVVGWKD
jgi:SAM-dependent methyltransferase